MAVYRKEGGMVLILEDSDEIAELYAVQAEIQGVPVAIAPDIPTAQALFLKYRARIRVMVFDGKINGQVQPTCSFVQKLRTEGFEGKMIAAALNPSTNDRLVEAGCDIKAHDKIDVIGIVARILNEQSG